MNYRQQPQMMVPLTQAVKWLLISTVGIWFFGQVLLESIGDIKFTHWLSLYPFKVIYEFQIWQIVTYMFLHTTEGFTHILFNMLLLWFIGSELEQRWGSRFFLVYYFVCGIGAALIYLVGMRIYTGIIENPVDLHIPVMGASGAIFGLLLAYGIIFGERIIYFFMLFPMKAKIFVTILGCIEIANMLLASRTDSNVANLAHLGGLATGYLYLLGYTRWQRRKWNQKAQQKHKGRNLKLVVDNDKSEPPDGPKYWN